VFLLVLFYYKNNKQTNSQQVIHHLHCHFPENNNSPNESYGEHGPVMEWALLRQKLTEFHGSVTKVGVYEELSRGREVVGTK
jgi:hypothetical protein